jgi:L-fuculokinase
MSIVVLDIGKSNVKLVLLDNGGNVAAVRSRPNSVTPAPPYPHFAIPAIAQWVIASLAALPARDTIEAIVPVAHGCAAALCAGEELALPMLDYEHSGPDETAAEYDRLADPFERSFTPRLPLGLVLGRQFFWQERRYPEAFARVTAILPNPQVWAWRLSGVTASEVTSLGSHTGLWLPAERTWSDLAMRQGWAQRMAPLCHAWDTLGPVRPELCAATGLDPACRVVCGVHDSNASFLAHRATRTPPFTVISTGTWTIVMAAGAPLARLDPARDMLANVDVFGEPVPTARFMGGREFALIAGEAVGNAASVADAARVVARGTQVRPAMVPESGPFAGQRGAIIGPAPETGAERVALANLYLALVVDTMLDLLGARPPFLVEGPSASSQVFLAALATLRDGADILASGDGTGTTAGAAVLAHWPRRTMPAAAVSPVGGERIPGLAAYRDRWREKLARPNP